MTSVAGFALTAVTGLRYTRVSADILFDMRLALYRHLQRLSPRFYARTPLGDILARVNNDVGEIQRVAAESLLAWVGNVLFLVGSVARDALARRRGSRWSASPLVPLSVWALSRVARAAGGSRPCRARGERRHRQLPHRDAAGDAARRDVERAGARGRRDSAARTARSSTR